MNAASEGLGAAGTALWADVSSSTSSLTAGNGRIPHGGCCRGTTPTGAFLSAGRGGSSGKDPHAHPRRSIRHRPTHGLRIADAVSLRALADDKADAIAAEFAASDEADEADFARKR